jgi:hypothetical protein
MDCPVQAAAAEDSTLNSAIQRQLQEFPALFRD